MTNTTPVFISGGQIVPAAVFLAAVLSPAVLELVHLIGHIPL